MSRIGKMPIPLPAGVTFSQEGAQVTVKGPKGTLSRTIPTAIELKVEDGVLHCRRPNEDRQVRSLHGLTRSLVNNMVVGVSQGFERILDITGVGYKAEVREANLLVLSLGYSHPVEHPLPAGVTAEVEKLTRVILRACDKELVGMEAAKIRAYRPPEPYKGKGVRYAGETIRRKVGKAGAA